MFHLHLYIIQVTIYQCTCTLFLALFTTFDFTVVPVNDAPVIDEIADHSINEDGQLDFVIISLDDVDTEAAKAGPH